MNMSAALLGQPPVPTWNPVMAGWPGWPSAWENAIVILHWDLDHDDDDDDAGAMVIGDDDPTVWHKCLFLKHIMSCKEEISYEIQIMNSFQKKTEKVKQV